MKIEWVEKCKECKGTGIYVGMAEQHSEYGVVCSNCEGTGKIYRKHEYEEFIEKEISSVSKVLETNPGIYIGDGTKDFGGISYIEWYNGKPFPNGSEMREFTCPAWWFQSADYNKKPRWQECAKYGSFSECKHFSNKRNCWKRWDEENKNE